MLPQAFKVASNKHEAVIESNCSLLHIVKAKHIFVSPSATHAGLHAGWCSWTQIPLLRAASEVSCTWSVRRSTMPRPSRSKFATRQGESVISLSLKRIILMHCMRISEACQMPL